jgi:phospholipid transport system substrate-binding protein
MLKSSIMIALLVALVLGTGSAFGQQDRAREIRSLLEQRDRQIKSMLGTRNTFTEQQREQLKSLINDVIDFRAMGRYALGPHWNNLTVAQQNEYVSLFADIVRAQSLSDLGIYRSQVNYGEIEVIGDSAHVHTTVTYRDVPTRVRYAMAFRDGQWHINDIILDDVSTAAGYARSFQSVVRRRGFDALMTSLRKRLEDVTAST